MLSWLHQFAQQLQWLFTDVQKEILSVRAANGLYKEASRKINLEVPDTFMCSKSSHFTRTCQKNSVIKRFSLTFSKTSCSHDDVHKSCCSTNNLFLRRTFSVEGASCCIFVATENCTFPERLREQWLKYTCWANFFKRVGKMDSCRYFLLNQEYK